MFKAYKFRLYPTKEQEILINKHFGCSRFIWNWALDKKMKAYQADKTNLSRYDLQAKLPEMKKLEEFKWLTEVLAQSLQSKLIDLEEAFVAFYKKKSDYPNFKSKKDKQSYSIPQRTAIDLENRKVFIPKFLEGIKYRDDRKIIGKITSSTVSKTPTGKYFISILTEDEKPIPGKPISNQETTIGIDLGITNFITTSGGEKIDNPRCLKKALKKLSRESRQLSRKQKGSKNREKQRKILSLVHEKVSNSRKDFQHKLSHKLTHDNQVNTIVMETLSIKTMMKNRRLAKHIQDCSWSQFQEFLKYKCEEQGKNFIQIGRYEPSSRLCSCGEINHKLTLKDRTWTCEACGITHDRDILAANNIKQIGLGQPELKPVESLGRGSTSQGYALALKQETKPRRKTRK